MLLNNRGDGKSPASDHPTPLIAPSTREPRRFLPISIRVPCWLIRLTWRLKLPLCMRVIIAVDYVGQPCDYDTLQWLAKRYGLALVAEGALWVPWRTSASSVFIR
jgi:hypothetical protein